MSHHPVSRRHALAAAAAVTTLLIGSSPSLAQAPAARYAQKAVKFVVPFPPGGAIDAMARPVAEALGRELGQTVFVENKPGAAGNIGSAQVAKAAADGYTLLVGTSATHGANKALFAKLPYDPQADFDFVSLWGAVPNVLVVNAASGPKSVDELVARARREPGTLSYGSAGTGTSLHLAGALFEKAAGVDLLHVPYKGGSPASMDLLGGSLGMMFDTVSVSLPNLRAGKLRALAVAAPERHFALPDVPTFAELGFKGVEAATWAGVFAPKGTPAPVLAELRAAHAKVLADKSVQEALRANGVLPTPLHGDRFRSFVDGEIQRWGHVVQAARITAE